MKISFRTTNLEKLSKDKDILTDDGSSLHMCVTPDGDLNFERTFFDFRYDKISIAEIVERIRV